MKISRADARKLGIDPGPAAPKSHQPNQLEAEYGRFLAAQYPPSAYLFLFESIKLRLADRTWYTPDFLVVWVDGRMEFHEVKGFMRDDAAVKLKVAAELYPWAKFILAKKIKGRWEMKVMPSGAWRRKDDDERKTT